MNFHFDKDSPLTKRLIKWKKDQAIISLTINEAEKEVNDKKVIIEQKVDGETALLNFGHNTTFTTLGGRIISNIPVLDEIEKIFHRKKITQAVMVGELAAMIKNKIVPFNLSQSIIKNPKSDKDKISWHPYQILEFNGKEIKDDFKSYFKKWPVLVDIFKGSKHIFPVDYYFGDKRTIQNAWEKLVLEENNEGLVIRFPDTRVAKVKPINTYDLVIVAVGDKKGKNWPKKMIGMTLMAFMDKDWIFRTAGHIGTGWSEAEAKELFNWAQKNKVGEDDTYVWVKPKKIVETRWERTTQKEMPSYRYENNEYKPAGKLMSGTIVKPRFIRYRTDKSVNPSDLRLTQIPDWGKKQMQANKIAQRFIQASMETEAKISIMDIVKKIPGAPRTVEQATKVLIDAAKKIGVDKVLKVIKDVESKQSILIKEAGAEEVGSFLRLYGNLILKLVAGAALILMLLGGKGALDSAVKKMQQAQQAQIEQIDTLYKV